jgi:alpha-L-rhamnosidase
MSDSKQHGQVQTAYRIIVSSSVELLDSDVGDIWDSGKIVSDQSINIKYGGIPLKYAMRCFWKVMLWDKNGEASNWSDPSYWSMGFLKPVDCQAIWIGFDRKMEGDETDVIKPRCAARYIRKEFDLTKKIKYATVSFSGLGSSELYINGTKISDAVLSPALTEYPKAASYVTYEITEYLHKGRNAFGVILGNGRYFSPRLKHYFGQMFIVQNYGFPKLILQAKIVFEDSTSMLLKSDFTWKITNQGPIISNNEYDGEQYDARRELGDWSKPGYDDASWEQSEVVPAGGEVLKSQIMDPIRITKTLEPISVKEIRPGIFIYDMGQNMVGWVQLKIAEAQAGTKIKMRFAETLQKDGSLFMDNIRTADVTDVYICKGAGQERYEPRFTYHGFRYVELTGFPGEPNMGTLLGKVVNDDLEEIGSFETSNETLNQIYKNALWSIRGNYRSIPTDCPQRDERQGWLGDRSVNSRGESFIFDNANFYSKWLDDIKFAQKENGAIPVVVPTYWDSNLESVTWSSTYLFITKMLYDQFGDRRVIEQHYPNIKKWFHYVADNFMEKFLLDHDAFGDWCVPPENRKLIHSDNPNATTPSVLLSTAFFYKCTKLLEEFAEIQGFEDDRSFFFKMGKSIKNAYNDTLFDKENKRYANNTVTSNILSLYFDLVPIEFQEDVFKNTVQRIEIDYNGHISTGLIGCMFLMRTLDDFGREDLAYRIASNRTYPSWGYMADQGATTIWELWNGDSADPLMNSKNHVMLLGDLVIWFYENLAGIKSKPGKAFKELIMKPPPYSANDLSFVKASYRSPYGKIISNWKKSKGVFTWDISLPPNTVAEIHLPLPIQRTLSSQQVLDPMKGMDFLRNENGCSVYRIGSGNHSLKLIHQ